MAVDMFLKLDGIKGESKDHKHPDEIEILSWSWGASQSGTFGTGGGGGSGKVNLQDFHFTKYVDTASNLLLKSCCNGKHIKEAMLVVRKAGEKPLEYLKIKFTDLLVSSFQSGGSDGADRVTESCSLNFAKFKLEYVKQKPDGTGEAAKEVSYDVTTGATT